MQLTVIIPDLQVPFHDDRAVSTLAKFIREIKPDQVCSAGDEMDMQTISRWAQGTELEYQRSIGKDRDMTVKVLELLQVQHVIRSNHTDRLFNTIHMRAPGLLGLEELQLENFLRFDQLGITYHKKPYALAPGWLLMHGDEGNISQTAGQTALNLAKKTGQSIVCGHTHRAGLMHHNTGHSGKTTSSVWGMEVGNLMRTDKASYLKAGISNWQQAFGLLWQDGNKVTPQLIPIHKDGTFQALGKTWQPNA
jgi:hypothetical protein